MRLKILVAIYIVVALVAGKILLNFFYNESVISSYEDGDYYVLPTLSFQIAGGVHTIRLYYGADNGGFSSENVNIRVVNGMTTHFSIGEQAGNLAVSVSFDIQDAIVN